MNTITNLTFIPIDTGIKDTGCFHVLLAIYDHKMAGNKHPVLVLSYFRSSTLIILHIALLATNNLASQLKEQC